VTFDDGLFATAKSNRRLSLFDVARAAREHPGLADELRVPLGAEATFTGRIPAYPTGAAVCEAEIDPDTGQVEITNYTSIDDGGQAINPLILHGQVHGGVAQGVGQALMEALVWDPGSAQMLSASFMDYAMPRADHFPAFAIELTEDPTESNALRVKGGGEAGITPSPAALINALVDALSSLGIEHIDMPATPERLWRAICETRTRQSRDGRGRRT
jgi:aerobic carbon-monoxide dehydrogenase large subunit